MPDMDELYMEEQEKMDMEFEEKHGRPPTKQETDAMLLELGERVTDRLADMVDYAHDYLEDR